MLALTLLGVTLAAVSVDAGATQARGLQIRVLAGDAVVNVIQQKSAVSPVVEVRDRNGLPVAGATVTFTIYGANLASFPGDASTFSVVTDAMGQATAAAISPLHSGTFAIRVQAVFQGLSGTVTLAQSNVATTAKAEAASAQATQAMPIGGKGVSARALGIIGAAAVGGGALAATQLAGDDKAPVVAVPAVPDVVARSFRLTGNFDATLVHNVSFPSGGTPCTLDHAVRIELSVDLTFVGDNLSTTAFRANETETPVGGTCTLTRMPTNTSIGSGPMSGPVSALSFRFARNFTQVPDGLTEVTDTLHEFTGMYDGTSVTGTYSFERRISVTGPGGYRQETASKITLPVTLR
jgi:hypothetical protein